MKPRDYRQHYSPRSFQLDNVLPAVYLVAFFALLAFAAMIDNQSELAWRAENCKRHHGEWQASHEQCAFKLEEHHAPSQAR